jgi:putative oxidoreductase
MTIQSTKALAILRVVIGTLIIFHGAIRIYQNNVVGFGEFLTLNGIPHGVYAAWVITAIEILGGLMFLLDKFVKPIGLLLVIRLSAEIYFVHLKNGVSNIGAERTSLEFGVLLTASFLVVALAQGKWK